MSDIIGRNRERKRIEGLLKSKKAELLVVTGRRRVGKTFLIRSSVSKQLMFEFTGAYKASRSTQLSNFYYATIDQFENLSDESKPKDWTEAFNLLIKGIKSKRTKKKQVVFIDEVPWLDTHKSGFLSALEYFWNFHISKRNNILLILCGSSNSWMYGKLIESKGGLHNRVTSHIQLFPFKLHEVEAYLKDRNILYNRYQIIQLYMILGGIPYYLNAVEKGLSVGQNIDQMCFSNTGILFNEFERLYSSTFEHSENHYAVIKALSKKPKGIMRSELVESSGLKDGGIFTRTVKELILTGFIRKTVPYNRLSRTSIYTLSDFFSMFHYKYMRNRQRNTSGNWNNYIKKPGFKSWSGYTFEQICFEHVDQIKYALGVLGVYTNTSSWQLKATQNHEGAQIDLLIDRDDQIINLCEAKFTETNFMVTKTYASKLRKRMSLFQYAMRPKKTIHQILITTYPPIENIHLPVFQKTILMDDLFKKLD